MEKETKFNFVKSEFGNCDIHWEIENYGFAAHGMKYELESPRFAVQPSATSWKFLLLSDQGLCDDTEMLFCLERKDSMFDTVCVNYDVSLTDQNKKKWKGARGEHCFKPNDKHCFSVPNIYYGKANVGLYNFHDRPMTVRCQMIVAYGKKHNVFDFLIDPGLKHLAEDMDQLYKSEKFTDAIINLDGSSKIVAHKAILSVRNEYMKDNFSENDPSVLNFSSLDSEGMQRVLRYIYTGDIVDVVDNPSISVHNCIDYLSIKELKNHFKANEMKLKSSIEVYETGFIWKIENFSNINEKRIVSDLMHCDMLEMVWKLILYPKGVDGDGEYLTVIAINVEGKISGNVWAKVEIYSDSFHRTWKTMKEVQQSEVFEIQNLDNRQSALEKLEEGALRIGFKACASFGVIHSSVDQGMNPKQAIPLEDYYKKLSKDIFQLRKDDKYTDVAITAENESFKAHKCILSVRSPKLDSKLGNQGEYKTINIKNVRPKIVEIILDYMYSGVIEMSDLSVIIEVYEAAYKMGADYLQQKCSKYLRKNMNEDNIFKIMTLAVNQRDIVLETAAFDFSQDMIKM